ncbi:MAG: hypothetical protein ACPGUC_02035 [Gammaproteobacteria bacterium]
MSQNQDLALGIPAMYERAQDMDVHLADLLMGCALPARKLGQRNFSDWMLAEVRGYAAEDALPAYRLCDNVHLLAWMPGSHWMQAPISDDLEHELMHMGLREGISTIEDAFLKHKGKGGVRVDLSDEQQVDLRTRANLDTRLALAMPSEAYARVLANTRVVIELWSKDLLDQGVVSCQNAGSRVLEKAAEIDRAFDQYPERAADKAEEIIAAINRKDGFLKRLFS